MSKDQMDLFDQRSQLEPLPVAETIPFPCSLRVGRARDVASKFLNKQSDKARQAYWLEVTNKMAARMRRDRIPECRIEREINDFRLLVQRIIDQRQKRGQA